MIFNKISVNEFDEIYPIMLEAFPSSERRDYEGQKSLLLNSNYSIYAVKNDDNNTIAFLSAYELNEYIFIEHFAVNKNFRSGGIGSKILSQYIKSVSKDIILEVEPPNTEISKRRIGFYKRLGFKLNEYYYVQPSLQEGEEPIELLLMSYPNEISEGKFIDYKQSIYKHIYNII